MEGCVNVLYVPSASVSFAGCCECQDSSGLLQLSRIPKHLVAFLKGQQTVPSAGLMKFDLATYICYTNGCLCVVMTHWRKFVNFTGGIKGLLLYRHLYNFSKTD